MLLVKKGLFVFTLLAGCALLLLVGVTGYRALIEKVVYTPQQLKYYAENAVFVSFLSVFMLFILFFVTWRKSVQVYNELDKIAQLSRYGKYYTGDFVKKLGKLGVKIDRLFFELNTLNDMKSLRISALSNLNQFLLENVHLKIFVTDIQGMVQSCSGKFVEEIALFRDRVLGKHISSLILELNFTEVTTELERNRTPIERPDLSIRVEGRQFASSVEFIPIFNVKNQLSEIVCVCERESILVELSKKTEQLVKIKAGSLGIKGIFKRRKGK
jgi:hypothetical protein